MQAGNDHEEASVMTKRVLGKWKAGVLVSALVFGGATALFAKQGVVKLRDGTVLEGDVTEKPENVTVKLHGVETVFERDRIELIEYLGDVSQQFDDRLAKLGPKDVPGRIALARWAFDSRRYDLARRALNAALEIDPNNVEATELLATVQRQMQLESKRPPAANSTVAPPRPGTTAPTPDGEAVGRKFLSPAQINVIRQHELSPNERNVRFKFENDLLRRFAQATGRNFADFRTLNPMAQAQLVLNEGDPKLRDDLKVLTEPASLLEYRRSIQPLVLNGCATSNCHGGANAGSLVFHNPADNEPASYTNFYALQAYQQTIKIEGSSFGGAGKLINRTQPTNSLLLQYGLPHDQADFDHPAVPGWRPVFRNRAENRFEQTLGWLRDSLVPVDPNYGIDFALPGAKKSEEPVTHPATGPATRTR
ncbi:MAG: tetratricopeptide repeat protein [Tepidisphaeraceae bacterium]